MVEEVRHGRRIYRRDQETYHLDGGRRSIKKITDPTFQLEREKMRRDSIKMRQRMRQRLCRYETDLAVFVQAWAERLGVVNLIDLKTKWKRYKLSRQIETLEEKRKRTREEVVNTK